MHVMQDYIVLCLDVGPSMNIAPPSGGDTHLEMALRVANQIVQQKVCLHTRSYYDVQFGYNVIIWGLGFKRDRGLWTTIPGDE